MLRVVLGCALVIGLKERAAALPAPTVECSIGKARAAIRDLDDRTQRLLVANYTDRGVDSLYSFIPAADIVVYCAAQNQSAGDRVRRDVVRASSSALALALSYGAGQLDGRVAGPLFLTEALFSIDGPITRFVTNNPGFAFGGGSAPRHWLPSAFIYSSDPIGRQGARALEMYALCEISPDAFSKATASLGYSQDDLSLQGPPASPQEAANIYLIAKIREKCAKDSW